MSTPQRIVRLGGRGILFAALMAGTVVAVISPQGAWGFFVPYATVGTILVAKQPRNSIGWIVLALGWSYQAASVKIDASAIQLATGAAGWQTDTLVWASNWAGLAALALFITLTVIFPDGRLPRGRAGVAGGFALGLAWMSVPLAAMLPSIEVTPGDAAEPILVPNAFALLHGGIWEQLLPSIFYIPLFALLLAGVGFMLRRFLRSQGLERQQLRWLVTSLAVITVTIILASLTPFVWPAAMGPAWMLTGLAFPLLPAAVGVAVLRYRLYELDLIINRSITYVLLTGLLAGLYAATVALFQKTFVGLTGTQSDGAVILSTLLLASVFTPARKWLEAIVDRRFKLAHDPASVVAVAGPPPLAPAGAIDWDARVAEIARRVFDEERAAAALADPARP